MIGIYMFKNLVNDKVYIGQSTNIEYRKYRHTSNVTRKVESPLYNGIRKYGHDNFKFSILCECKKEELNKMEAFYINKYKSLYPDGYNIHKGGSGCKRTTDKLDGVIDEVYDLIEKTEMYFEDIAKKYNVHKSLISKINLGNRYFLESKEYPLRIINNRFSKKQLNKIVRLLKEDRFKIVELAKMFNTSAQAISNINNGRTNYDKNLNYPLRKSRRGRNGKVQKI